MEAADATSHTAGGIDVLFFCNPLLDISIDDPEAAYLNKYKLFAGHACLANDDQKPMFEEIFHKEGRLLIPGGSALNSARACGWSFLKQTPGKGVVGYMGCIGNDERGQALSDAVKASGVKASFQVDDQTETGACAVIVHGKERALCAFLGASCKYSTDHLNSNMA